MRGGVSNNPGALPATPVPAVVNGRALEGWYRYGARGVFTQVDDRHVVVAWVEQVSSDAEAMEDHSVSIILSFILTGEPGRSLSYEDVAAVAETIIPHGVTMESISAMFTVEGMSYVPVVLNLIATGLVEFDELFDQRRIVFAANGSDLDGPTCRVLSDQSLSLLDRLCVLVSSAQREVDGWTEAELRTVLKDRPAQQWLESGKSIIGGHDSPFVHMGFVCGVASSTAQVYRLMNHVIRRSLDENSEVSLETLPIEPDPNKRTDCFYSDQVKRVGECVTKMSSMLDEDEVLAMLDRPFRTLLHISNAVMRYSSLVFNHPFLIRTIFAMVGDNPVDWSKRGVWAEKDRLDFRHAFGKDGDEIVRQMTNNDEFTADMIAPCLYFAFDSDALQTQEVLCAIPQKFGWMGMARTRTSNWMKVIEEYTRTDRSLPFDWYAKLSITDEPARGGFALR